MVRAAPAKKRSSSAQIGSSSAASACGLPTLSDSSAASSSPWRSTMSASASSSSWRRPGVASRHGIRAARAAATARSTSAALPSGTRAMVSPVAGLTISRVAPSTASSSSPPTRLRWCRTAVTLTPSPARSSRGPCGRPRRPARRPGARRSRRAAPRRRSAAVRSAGPLSPRSSARAISPASRRRPGRKPRSSSSRSAWSKRRVVVVLDQLHRPEEAVAADVADDRQVGERAQRLGEVGRQGLRTFSSTPSRSKISMFFSAIAAATGWPPKVMPWRKIAPCSTIGAMTRLARRPRRPSARRPRSGPWPATPGRA